MTNRGAQIRIRESLCLIDLLERPKKCPTRYRPQSGLRYWSGQPPIDGARHPVNAQVSCTLVCAPRFTPVCQKKEIHQIATPHNLYLIKSASHYTPTQQKNTVEHSDSTHRTKFWGGWGKLFDCIFCEADAARRSSPEHMGS